MTLTQVGGVLVILIVCPILGALPLIDWLTYGLSGKRLSRLGTGNISVSAAFYHGGKWVGIMAVLSEATKGILAVLLTRVWFNTGSVWEIVALIALVMGRYWSSRGAGTTNVVWGIVVHDWIVAVLVFIIGGLSFTILRQRKTAKIGVLVLFSIIVLLRHPYQLEYGGAAIALSALLIWIYQQIPDDLDLPASEVHSDSASMLQFWRGDRLLTLDSSLKAEQVGNKAARLAQLKRLGYAVAEGWVLPAGDDSDILVNHLHPSPDRPLIVRSSAVGEDSDSASAAGQYRSILNVTNRDRLQSAIVSCLASYHEAAATDYRRQHQQTDAAMAVLVQRQIRGEISGVAFSRNPVNQLDDCVLIEAMPGDATTVVSGRVTPQQYQVYISDQPSDQWRVVPQDDQVSPTILQTVAQIAREIETVYGSIPQDLEWTYADEQVWLLQARPVSTMQTIWTRKIAAEVIPGVIKPLTWSINQPLTCGVWGELFTVVLGKESGGLDFEQTATLHYSRAYFNATLLGEIFLRMGLPPESLDFLTRGSSFTRPPISSTIKNIPGLWRLLQRELSLTTDFSRDDQKLFQPTLDQLQQQKLEDLSSEEILARIEIILTVLKSATYYSILAPLSYSLRQALLKVPETELNTSSSPEVKSVDSLAQIAQCARQLVGTINAQDSASVFAQLAEVPDGDIVLAQFNEWLQQWGYLCDATTDIAQPRWQENSQPVKEIFTSFLLQPPAKKSASTGDSSWKTKIVQRRLELKGQVTQVYSKLLAHLRWSLVALEQIWQSNGLLAHDEIFMLELEEIRQLVVDWDWSKSLSELIYSRQRHWQENRALERVPLVVYGDNPAVAPLSQARLTDQEQLLTGIGASPGETTGRVKVLHSLTNLSEINKQTIIVVPYTDAGWSPALSRAGGIVSEVGGRLSHGAIVAREYGIPAVMGITDATQILQDGQLVSIDGQLGTIKINPEN